MNEFLEHFAVMLIGAVLPLWLRAVKFAGWKAFSWEVFFGENLPRIILAFVGVTLVSVLSRIDQNGITQVLSMIGLSSVSIGGNAVIGVAIGTMCFLKKRKE